VVLHMQAQTSPTQSAEVYAALKDDPELQHVFEEVKANGPSALQKWVVQQRSLGGYCHVLPGTCTILLLQFTYQGLLRHALASWLPLVQVIVVVGASPRSRGVNASSTSDDWDKEGCCASS
jgi:hypothetical protein